LIIDYSFMYTCEHNLICTLMVSTYFFTIKNCIRIFCWLYQESNYVLFSPNFLKNWINSENINDKLFSLSQMLARVARMDQGYLNPCPGSRPSPPPRLLRGRSVSRPIERLSKTKLWYYLSVVNVCVYIQYYYINEKM